MARDQATTWIVTGGAGFIGANFTRAALDAGQVRVIVLDKLTYAGNLQSLREVSDHPRFHFERGDIADRPALDRLFQRTRPDAVINFAAESHVDRSIDGPVEFVHTNVLGTLQLLEASRAFLAGADAAVRNSFRFLQISTDEVFGSLGAEGMFTESTPFAPNSPYSASKAGADHLVRAYFETFRLPTLITHCSNNYGPYQFPEKLIPLMTLNALEGKPLPVYGDGGNVRDWLHVEDHCAALLRVLADGRPGEHFNIGGRSERTNLQVLDAICTGLEEIVPAGENPALRERGISSYRELQTFVPDRPGHDRRYAIDTSHIRQRLGWEPKIPLEEGLRRTIAWYVSHRDWCEAVQSGSYRRERLGLGAADQAAEERPRREA